MNPSLIFDFKHYAINDGPGIRITVFFKGCPLSCKWCHNPESHSIQKQKMYSREKCIGCEDCVEVCAHGACVLAPEGIITNTEACVLCGKCADICPTKATVMSGRELSVDEVMAEIKKEVVFMDQSGGGVTFSGGEPLLHPELLIPLLDACKAAGIHNCVDTSGFAGTNLLLNVAQKTDLFLYDLKLMDSQRHQKFTGVSNELILKNLQSLSNTNTNIIIRIPLIKGINDDEDNIERAVEFISSLAGNSIPVELLPYHNTAARKRDRLGCVPQKPDLNSPLIDRQLEILALFERAGIATTLGG